MTDKRNLHPFTLLGIAFVAFIAIGLPPGLLNIAWTYMHNTFGVSFESLGILLTVATIGRLVSAFTSGRLSASTGLGVYMAIGSLCEALGALGFILVPSWEALLLAAMVASFGSGMIDAGLNTFVSTRYSAGPLNWLHAFFGVGLTIGPILVTFVVVQLGESWRWSYAPHMILQVGLAATFFLTRRHWKLTESTSTQAQIAPAAPAATILSTLKIPLVLMGLVLFFVYGGVEYGAGQLTNTLFMDSRGVPQETAGFWIGFYWASFTIGRMITGSVVKYLTSKRMMRLSMVGSVIGAAMLWLNFTNLFGFIGLALLGFAQAPMFATLISETPRRVGLSHTANAIGFQIGVAGLGSALLPGLAGVMIGGLGLEFIGFFILLLSVILLLLHELILLRESPMSAVGTAD